MAFFQLTMLSVFVILSSYAKEESTTLLLVQTIFRHGDRAPIRLYPNDPNSVDCFPNGLKQLTQLGKRQHYHVGKLIRSMYEGFDMSNPNQIYVNSSVEDRCLNSAESNLASFYAPTKQWKIAEHLNWQPIPIHYLPKDKDIYLNIQTKCPRFSAAFQRALNSNEFQEFYQTHQTAVENIKFYSGVNVSDPKQALYLFDTLKDEKMHNLIIPEWANTYWHELSFLFNKTLEAYFTYPIQVRLRIGPFLGLLTKNLKDKMNGITPNLKFILNSSHDVNIAGILKALNFKNMPRPPYCATLLFELHELADCSMAVRLLYMNSTHPLTGKNEPHVLVLDGCSEFCPVDYFMESYQHLIPKNLTEECQIDT